jgi:hypothetical protein
MVSPETEEPMGAVTIQQMADRVAALMEERLAIRGKGLTDKLKRGGRLLPHRVRDAAGRLAESAHLSQHPRLLLQVDEARVAEDYDICVRHLGSLDIWDRRKGVLVSLAGSIVVSLIIVGAAAAAFAYWRGLI